MMSTLLAIITYSSGMPILYLIGAVFYSITFIVNKAVIFQFYQRSLTLDRVVPNYSMQFLNMSLLIHILFGCFMLTNPSLYTTMSNPSKGFKMPEMKFNPATELKKAADIPTNELNNSTFINDEEEIEISFSDRALAATSDRLNLQHQQLYFAFTVCVLAFQICGELIIKLLTTLYNQVMKILKGIYACVVGIIKGIYNCIRKIGNFISKTFKSLANKVFTKVGVEVELEIVDEEKEKME
jgi:hypothetical protein